MSQSGATSRVLEGDIVGIVDHEKSHARLRQARKLRTSKGFIPIHLLIDRDAMLPFLERLDVPVGVSQLSPIERKQHRYEETIKGKGKIIVKVNLADAVLVGKQSLGDHNVVELTCKWVLRKQVIVNDMRHANFDTDDKGIRKYVSKQYVGNKHDSDAQQEQNWRWMARRLPQDGTLLIGQVMKVSSSTHGDDNTLAMVSLKRLLVPELSVRGRTPSDGALEVFEEKDVQEFQVPVEQVVIASRKVLCEPNSTGEFAIITRSYSSARGSWSRSLACEKTSDSGSTELLFCHRCGVEGQEMLKDHIAVSESAISCARCLDQAKLFGKSGTFLKSCRCVECCRHHAEIISLSFAKSVGIFGNYDERFNFLCPVCCLRCKSGVSCADCDVSMHKRCARWVRFIETQQGKSVSGFMCRACRRQDAISSPSPENHVLEQPLVKTCEMIKSLPFTDFDLPVPFVDLTRTQHSSNKPITAMKPRAGTPSKQAVRTPKRKLKQSQCASDKEDVSSLIKKQRREQAETTFKPSCSRLLPYDPVQRRFEGISRHQLAADYSLGLPDVLRNLRSVGAEKTEEKQTMSRAARANQRRIMKDVAAFGATSLELDALAGRESYLRFDRSGIHAWGVFADQEIREGELIVEYRGEIIGNAMAEKREKEYEQAKIGSDYMFRIDTNSVCDATKQGNVARFINASCDPNCYTQIISINNTKRIVIYAKKDIKVGQELCYDYKFPMEFSEEKRIPCHCGSPICRGFMNWDKRYVALPPQTDSHVSSSLKSVMSSPHPWE
jgi:histone-lysine N-methyltransferase SETD1